jgi:hypothetical protein
MVLIFINSSGVYTGEKTVTVVGINTIAVSFGNDRCVGVGVY